MEERPFRAAWSTTNPLGFSPCVPLQLSPQHLHHLTDGLLIAPIPAPLAMLGRLDQSGLRQNPHVMRDRRLRKANAFLNLSAAKTMPRNRVRRRYFRPAFFQYLQNLPPRRIGNRVKRPVERCVCSHNALQITRKSMTVNVGNCPGPGNFSINFGVQ